MKKDDLKKDNFWFHIWEKIKYRCWYIVLLIACTVFVFSNWKKL